MRFGVGNNSFRVFLGILVRLLLLFAPGDVAVLLLVFLATSKG
jgi:hypothetical protein